MIDVHERCEMACEVLKRTHDGGDLTPEHLYLIQELVNGNLNEKGIELFRQIHGLVMAGNYKKPWLCGVENLTRDHEGYVYWRGKHIEHYSYDNHAEMKKAAEELARRCLLLEKKGIEVNCLHAVWKWDENKPDGGY